LLRLETVRRSSWLNPLWRSVRSRTAACTTPRKARTAFFFFFFCAHVFVPRFAILLTVRAEDVIPPTLLLQLIRDARRTGCFLRVLVRSATRRLYNLFISVLLLPVVLPLFFLSYNLIPSGRWRHALFAHTCRISRGRNPRLHGGKDGDPRVLKPRHWRHHAIVPAGGAWFAGCGLVAPCAAFFLPDTTTYAAGTRRRGLAQSIRFISWCWCS